MYQHNNTGLLLDNRLQQDKDKDYDKREVIASSTPVVWQRKTKWKEYPKRDQYQRLTCMMESVAKYIGIKNQLETGEYYNASAVDGYARRSHNGGGMNWNDAARVCTRYGLGPFDAFPDPKTEYEISRTPLRSIESITEALDKAQQLSFTLDYVSMDEVAQVIQSEGACILMFYFADDGREFQRKYPQIFYNMIRMGDRGVVYHAVVATDFGIDDDGKQVIKIEDSARDDLKGEQNRFIDANFINRAYLAGFFVDKKNMIYKPKSSLNYHFTRALKLDMEGDDVKALQRILVAEECMTLKNGPTGYFGGMTLKGVKNLQEKYRKEILVPAKVPHPTGNVGIMTLAWLNKKYKL